MSANACCPRCGAKTEDEAERICQPGDDECPMDYFGCPDWDSAIRRIQEIAADNEQYAKQFVIDGVVKS